MLRKFLIWPYSHMELEIYISVTETLWGVILLAFPARPLQFMFHAVPHQIIAVPWLIAGITNFVGLVFFFHGFAVHRQIRWWGSLLSLILWSWMAVFTLLAEEGLYSLIFAFYLCNAVASFRLMFCYFNTNE